MNDYNDDDAMHRLAYMPTAACLRNVQSGAVIGRPHDQSVPAVNWIVVVSALINVGR